METTLNLTTVSEYKIFAKTLSKQLNISYNKTLDKIAISSGFPGGWNQFLPTLESNLKRQYKHYMEEPELEDVYNKLQEELSFKSNDQQIIAKSEKIFKLHSTETIMGGKLVLLDAWIPESMDTGVLDIYFPSLEVLLQNQDAEIFQNYLNDYNLRPRHNSKDMDPSFHSIIQERMLDPVSKKIIKPIGEHVFAIGIAYEIWAPKFQERRLLSLKIVKPEEFSKYRPSFNDFVNKYIKEDY